MSRLTRRRVVGAAATGLAGLGLTGFARQADGSGPEAPATAPAKDGRPAARTGHGEPQPFDEVFRGRRIQGGPADLGQHGGNQRGTRSGTGAHGQEEHDQGQHGDGGHGGGYSVRIDGAELHVMRNADGTWISVVNHYETFPTPRAVARAAVLELRGAQLEPMF